MKKLFDKNILYELYINKGLSTTEIAKQYKCSNVTISKYLKIFHIKARPTSLKISQQIKKTGKKTCPCCKKIKTISKFYNKRGYCKKCISIQSKTERIKNPEKYLQQRRKYVKNNHKQILEKGKIYRSKHPKKIKDVQLKWKYGISFKDYIRLSKSQKNKCAICGKLKKLQVDHNHKTGKIRGLLCQNCNFVLGFVKDKINILKKSILYLKRYKS